MDKKLNYHGTPMDANGNVRKPHFYFRASLHNSDTNSTDKGNDLRVLHVSSLSPEATKKWIEFKFCQFGPIIKIDIVKINLKENHAFVEFKRHQSAKDAIQKMNNVRWMDRFLKVEWSLDHIKEDESQKDNATIFVGGLSCEVTSFDLEDIFKKYGEIQEIKLIPSDDPSPKAYGFVTFSDHKSAKRAIYQMDGRLVYHCPIRTNWGQRKNNDVFDNRPSFNRIFAENRDQSTVVCITNLSQFSTSSSIAHAFERFGPVVDIALFEDYALVTYENVQNAASAIYAMNNTIFGGKRIGCWWGKALHEQEGYEMYAESNADWFMTPEQHQHYWHWLQQQQALCDTTPVQQQYVISEQVFDNISSGSEKPAEQQWHTVRHDPEFMMAGFPLSHSTDIVINPHSTRS